MYKVPVREYRVFHELLADLLHAAGLPGPVRELAAMRPVDAEVSESMSVHTAGSNPTRASPG